MISFVGGRSASEAFYFDDATNHVIDGMTRANAHLFQERYKSIVVEGEEYLLSLSRYVHLNPVRGKGNRAIASALRSGVRTVSFFPLSEIHAPTD